MVFWKENFGGPSFHYKDAESKLNHEKLLKKQMIPQHQEVQSNYNPEWNIGKVNNTLIYFPQENSSFIDNYLSLGGEQFRNIQLKHIFIILKILSEYLQDHLWIARINFLHNQFLIQPVQQLKDIIIDNFNIYLDKTQLQEKERACLLSELSYIYDFYYKYQEAEQCLDQAQQLLKVKFELAGRLGKRTKYQEFKTAQLIATAIEDTEYIQQENQDIPNAQQLLQEFLPVKATLPEDTILYEKPLIEDDLPIKNSKSELCIEDQIVVLALINHMKKNIANDEILQQQVSAFLELMLDKSKSWAVYSQGLLLRSINEYSYYKKMERSLAQMQVLADQYNDKVPDLETRFRYSFYVNFPDYYNLSAQLGEMWMKVGGIQSGYQIFSRLEMWDECVDCILQMGDTQRTLKEIEQLIFIGKGSIRMKCVYAEIKNDKTLLKNVWKESNKRFARAQRSLAEISFFQEKNYAKAIKQLQKALKINSYQHRSWFILGCSYMRLNQLEEAIKSFGQSVSINEKDAESWGNMAACMITLKKFKEAMGALEQGVKHSESDWKLWSNLMAISLKNKKFYKFYQCIERLISLNQHGLIDEQIFIKINQTFQYQIQISDQESARQMRFTKERIHRLYEFLVKEIGQRYYVWEGLAIYSILCLEYEQRSLEFGLEVDIELRRQQLYDDIANFRMKSIQMLMTVGWEQDMQIIFIIQQKHLSYRKM
ncbi:hypothetical protein pb186bvf_019125 [Paramecium bursaria]